MNRGPDPAADAFIVEVPPDRAGDFRQPWFRLLVALDAGSLRGMQDTDVVWERIEDHEGETFHLVRGGAFTYRVVGGQVVPDRTPQQIPKSQFAKALERLPLAGPGEIQDLRGPSFVFAIISDPRISAGEW